MCGQDDIAAEAAGTPREQFLADQPFPWHIGVFDAHCHLAERMQSTRDLPTMKAHGVAVMATRSQDQSLVADIARQHNAATSSERLSKIDKTTAVPGFGRHPWFSHELYDDTATDPTFVPPRTSSPLETPADHANHDSKAEALEAAKRKHYAAVLTPSPEDPVFVEELPTPIPLSTFISETRELLNEFPLGLVGEIGLDKAFRLAQKWTPEHRANRDLNRTPGGRERRPLGQHKIAMAHQLVVFKAHLALAGELGRPVSVHGVQVHGVLYDALVSCWKGHEVTRGSRREQVLRSRGSAAGSEAANSTTTAATEGEQSSPPAKPYPPRICLHSFSGKSDAVRQYLNPRIPAKIFYSFSRTNNMRDEAGRAKMEDAVRVIPDNRLLVESDLHTAGDRIDGDLEETCRAICQWKGWTLEEGVARLAANYKEFISG